MNNTLKQVFFSLFFASVIVVSSYFLKSDFIGPFLDQNLFVLLLALTALNGSTIGIIVGKMSDIIARDPDISFASTRSSLKAINIEQLFLIAIVLVLQILKQSAFIKSFSPFSNLFFDTLLAACLIHSILIVFDMLNAIYILIDKES